MRQSRTLPDETVERAHRDNPRRAAPLRVVRTADPDPSVETALADQPPTVALLLFSAYRSMESRIFGALTRAGFDDVTPAQARLFRGVRPGGSRMTELAEGAHVTKQTAGFLVDQLERAGYVTRVADPADARARLVKIAPRGAAAIAIGASAVAEAEAEWTASIGPERMAGLREALQMLWDRSKPLH